MWSILLLAASAWGASPAELAVGWYLAESGRLEEAARVAVKALNEERDDLEAHRLYGYTVRQGLKEASALEQDYRAWVAARPQDSVPRLALAAFLAAGQNRRGPWCDEVTRLLDPLPRDTGLRYQAVRVRYESAAVCGRSPAEDGLALLELARTTPTALGYGLKLRIESGKVDEEVASDLRTFYALEPWNLDFPGNLWSDRLKGPALKQARLDAIVAAKESLKVASPACAQAALRVYEAAGNDPGRVEAVKRRAELDPGWRAWERVDGGGRVRPDSGMSRLERDLEMARRKASVAEARRSLEALDGRIPPTGTLRATWLKEMAFVLKREGKEKDAFATFKAAWQADPGNASAANAFAYSAALRGEELDLALVVIESVLKESPPYDPWSDWRGEGYDTWEEKTANQVAARLDTRGWILYQLGRKEEAAAQFQRALLTIRRPEPIIHIHLGLALHDLGKDDAALQQLGRGLAMGASDEPELDRRARGLAEELFRSRRWSAGGLDAWLATRAPEAAGVGEAGVTPSRASVDVDELRLVVNGREGTLADHAGVRVVVLWSARSQAFEESLAYWEDLEVRYRSRKVQVIGVCVDDDPTVGETYWKGVPAPPFLLGWGGPVALVHLGVPASPLALVVDPEGRVRGEVPGRILVGDLRLDRLVDGLLSGQAP